MWSNRRDLKFWFGAWWPVAVGVAVIAMESTEYFGADRTSGPLRWIFQLLFGPVGDARWAVIHHYLRKSGHFLGYGAIGLAWLRAWRMSLPNAQFLTDAALALLGTGLLASWDEWHQGLLPNRTGSPWDVLLDCSGALIMLWMAYVSRRIHRSAESMHSG
jgi:VanZ family protein